MKMLFELKQHLNKRGIFKFEHLEMFWGHQLSCKLCDICYMLVVAEHELIDIEETVARSLGIPKLENEEVARRKNKVIKDHYVKQHSKAIDKSQISSKLQQWWMLFSFKDF